MPQKLRTQRQRLSDEGLESYEPGEAPEDHFLFGDLGPTSEELLGSFAPAEPEAIGFYDEQAAHERLLAEMKRAADPKSFPLPPRWPW